MTKYYVISSFAYTINMIKKLDQIKLFAVLGALITLILGALNHFIYEWTGENAFAGLLFATNESIWEHIKLALLPMFLIFLVGDFLFSKKVNNYFLAVFCALSIMVFFIIFAFLGYTVFTRKSMLPIDITIFTIAIILGYFTAYRIFFWQKHKILNYLAIFGILFWVALFLTCTYHAPDFFLFREMYVQ